MATFDVRVLLVASPGRTEKLAEPITLEAKSLEAAEALIVDNGTSITVRSPTKVIYVLKANYAGYTIEVIKEVTAEDAPPHRSNTAPSSGGKRNRY